jgi:hypothetical protein
MRKTSVSKRTCQTTARNNGAGHTDHERRLALVAGISGGRLNRLRERIRQEGARENGGPDCPRLRAGNVDCECAQCRFFWERLELILRGDVD